MAGLETYDMTLMAEDVQDAIYNIAPVDTVVMSMARDVRATSTLHEWGEDTLRAAATNAKNEGAAAAFSAPAAQVRLTNWTQIFSETAEVSGTSDAVRQYGKDGAMAYELDKKYKELANDMEFAIVGTPASGGTVRQTGSAGDGNSGSVAPRLLKPLQDQLHADVIIDAATFLPDGADAGSDPDPIATVADLEQAMLAGQQASYTAGGRPNYLVVPTAHAMSVAGFAKRTDRQRDISNARVIVNTIDEYVSPFGTLDVVLDRNLDDETLLGLDFEFLANGVLRPTTDYEIAKIGDSDRRQIIGERTFCVLNRKASFCVDNIPAALT
jgi:hypothetical protein